MYYTLSAQTLISSSKVIGLVVLIVPDYLSVLCACGSNSNVVVVVAEDMECSSGGKGFSQMMHQNVFPVSENA